MNSISHLLSSQFSCAEKLCGYSEVNLLAETQPLVENAVCFSADSESQSLLLQGCVCVLFLLIFFLSLTGIVRETETFPWPVLLM